MADQVNQQGSQGVAQQQDDGALNSGVDIKSDVFSKKETNRNSTTEPTPEISKINREFQENAAKKQAHAYNMPYINIAKTPLNPDFLKTIDVEDAKIARVIPFFKVGKKLRIAVEDPHKEQTIEMVRKLEDQGYEVELNMASVSGLDDGFKIYDNLKKYKSSQIIKDVDVSKVQNYEKEILDLQTLPDKLAHLTAEEALNLINIAAMRTKSSDVHFEPEEEIIQVRFRIDGILHKVFELEHSVYSGISEQLKYQSKMQLNVNTIPQDGRYVFTYNDQKIAVRVASIPTPYGESFVCRYLPSNKKALTFEELGFTGTALKKLENATKISQGMVLVTGPTGSGKSTTLYAILSKMNTPENKIITLEDPVEYYMRGVTQSQIDEKRDYTFASGLRSILRHDPDIIMIGEIRDMKTAETASQAALTGHVLLSTLHTNSAIETIPRLINMGLPPYMVAPALNTLVAQRLVRKVCPHCSTKRKITEAESHEFDSVLTNLKKVNTALTQEIPQEVAQINGCEACSNTGYLGRIVLAEVITIDSEIKNLILNNASTVDIILASRKAGMVTMREDGYLKVAKGLTTLEEVHRVTDIAETTAVQGPESKRSL